MLAVSGRALGTAWTVKWQPADADGGPAPAIVQARLAALLEDLERRFSTYRPDSELSQFNHLRSTSWFPASPELAGVVTQARAVSSLTDGAFDATVAPLLELWGFGPHGARATWPAEAEVASARARVDWRQFEARTDPPALRKARPEIATDLSSIAKGFAVDELSRQLAALGAANHLVQIGGDLRAAGVGPDGGGWRVGIEDPTLPARGMARVLALRDQALSTSGNYRNQLTLAGRVVGHLLDPRTGRPAEGPLVAVSVIAGDCARSSALATGLFVLGANAGPALATRERLAALFLAREGAHLRQQATPAFDAPAP